MSATQKLTPFLAQYLEVKGRYQDALLFFRMGDFYELFFDDAVVVAKAVEIALTARNKNNDDPIPMCGVPHHAAAGYINKLVSMGYKVALCEQLEDPATVKGIVKRDVVRVVTPGAQFDPSALDAKTLNLTHAAQQTVDGVSFSSIDYTTGAYVFGHFDSVPTWMAYIKSHPIAEVIVPDDDNGHLLAQELALTKIPTQRVSSHWFDHAYATTKLFEQFATIALSAIHKRLSDTPGYVQCSGALIKYFQDTQKSVTRVPLAHSLRYFDDGLSMDLDSGTITALDLLPVDHRINLFELIDKTKTALGGRLLKSWVTRPSTDLSTICQRHDDVGWLLQNTALRAGVSNTLAEVYDLERLLVRSALGGINGRELKNLASSIEILRELNTTLHGQPAHAQKRLVRALGVALVKPLCELAAQTLKDFVATPPVSVKEGGLFNRGVDATLDEYISLCEDGTSWLAQFEAEEKKKSGIQSLKVRFNKVFGYYIEITKANLASVPEHYIRKQTTAQGERYITAELKEFEEKILNAESRRVALEYALFQSYREQWNTMQTAVSALAAVVAELDCISALALCAETYSYAKPEMNEGFDISITEGRHPLVEQKTAERKGGFVSNSIELSAEYKSFHLITGPNMGGKSTIMRQTALIVLLAQMGSYVPARAARIGVVDRIFTRIGAADNIAEGQSTFMVEMAEMSFILKNATSRSLILLDEIGRGTSTYDGLSIAYALCEEILLKVKCRTLFATHYHELTALAERFDKVLNLRVGVEVSADKSAVRFLYKLEHGAARRSYGIAVARLAGLPERVLTRAETILARLEEQKSHRVVGASTSAVGVVGKGNLGVGADQLGLFS